jgi:hypothetical protein
MKQALHLFVTILAFFAASQTQAQTGFRLKETTYVGALSANASEDWTTGWTNFDPKTKVYADPNETTTLDASAAANGIKYITTTVTLDATKVYLLKGFIVVRAGGKLVIPAGTVIRGLGDPNATIKNYATIVVERDGDIEVLGTPTNPVVFTSAKAVGARDRGDWGGIVVCGKALNNQFATNPTGVQLEGFNTIDATLARHGGTETTDNSGIIKYCRIEFGGLAFEPNREINGLTLGSVGSGTQIDHIQVSFCNDDSFEWFGGSVNSSHLISFKTTDDDFDTDFGYTGLSQFGIALRDPLLYDLSWAAASNGSTSEGFESNNDGNGAAFVTPYTSAVFSNYTMMGPVAVGGTYAALDATTKGAFRRGARIRANSSQRVVNSIFMGYRNFVSIEGDSCVRHTNFPAALGLVNPGTPVPVATKQISFANNLIINTTAAAASATDTTANGLVEVARAPGSAAKLAAVTSWVRQTGALANKIDVVAFTAGTVLVEPLSSSVAPNFRPVAGSPALSGANFRDNPVLANLYFGLSSKDVEKVKMSPVYPNPISNGTLNFGKTVASFGIFDATGRLIQHGFDTDRATIQGYKSGIYFIKLEGVAQKFIVE